MRSISPWCWCWKSKAPVVVFLHDNKIAHTLFAPVVSVSSFLYLSLSLSPSLSPSLSHSHTPHRIRELQPQCCALCFVFHLFIVRSSPRPQRKQEASNSQPQLPISLSLSLFLSLSLYFFLLCPSLALRTRATFCPSIFGTTKKDCERTTGEHTSPAFCTHIFMHTRTHTRSLSFFSPPPLRTRSQLSCFVCISQRPISSPLTAGKQDSTEWLASSLTCLS